MPTPKDTFVSIDTEQLEQVAGGARASSSDAQLTQMLTQITSSIKDLANNNNSGSDPMQLMLIMMMMGGFGGGGGGGGYVGGGVAAGPPVINVDTGVSGGGGGWPRFAGGGCSPCGRRGKKGW